MIVVKIHMLLNDRVCMRALRLISAWAKGVAALCVYTLADLV